MLNNVVLKSKCIFALWPSLHLLVISQNVYIHPLLFYVFFVGIGG
jgi:hypothetical protein